MSKTDYARLVGREYDVKLAYTVEYDLRVLAGPEEQSAIEEAELRRLSSEVEPSEHELIHTEVEKVRDIFEDEPEAGEIADWIDSPSAPSEETYWDDSRHFEEESGEEVVQ